MLMKRISGDGAQSVATEGAGWEAAERAVWDVYRPALHAPGTWRAHRRALGFLRAAAPGGPTDVDVEAVLALREGLLRGLWTTRPLAPGGVNSVLRTVRAQCSLWRDEGLIERSPFEGRAGRRLFAREPRRRPLEGEAHHGLEAMRRLFARADDEWRDAAASPEARFRAGRRRALLYVLAYTGCRKSEALWLRWRDVDEERGVLWILDEDRRLKTSASAGPVAMHPRLREALAEWRPSSRPTYVLCQRRADRPWTQGSPGYRPTDDLKALGERAGVRGVTMLSLRKTWATHAESAWGLTHEQARRVLRHTSEATGDWYRQFDLPNLRRIAERIDYGE